MQPQATGCSVWGPGLEALGKGFGLVQYPRPRDLGCRSESLVCKGTSVARSLQPLYAFRHAQDIVFC